jgi:hypothetical protein
VTAFRVPAKPLTVRKRNSHGRNKSEREHWAFAYGTDRDFIEFVRSQPSAFSGGWAKWDGTRGEGRCEAAHWRTAATSGTAFKAPYSCIPLTMTEHRRQHQYGCELFGDRAWWKEKAEHYLMLWVETVKLKKGLI